MDTFEGYVYEELPDQKAGIVRYEGDDTEVIIPAVINGLSVTTVREHAFAFTDVEDVTVQEGVETIETEAFAACDFLKVIKLPGSLQTLGRGAFKGSAGLMGILFPEGNEKFYVEKGILYDREEQALVCCPPGLRLESYTVPGGIKKISYAAFYSNQRMKRVELPETLKKIEAEAFLFMPELHKIMLPESLEEIEPDAFHLTPGWYAGKPFVIFAHFDTVGYQYAVDNKILVQPIFQEGMDAVWSSFE